MLYLAIGITLFTSFIFLLKWLSSTTPQKVKRAYKITMILLGLVFIYLFIKVGMPYIAAAIGAIIAAAPYFSRIVQLLYTFRFLRGFVKEVKNNPTANNKSKQETMTVKQAREILEVDENASNKQINDAYKRLMKKNHPDTGGSKYIASQLNEAKNILLN